MLHFRLVLILSGLLLSLTASCSDETAPAELPNDIRSQVAWFCQNFCNKMVECNATAEFDPLDPYGDCYSVCGNDALGGAPPGCTLPPATLDACVDDIELSTCQEVIASGGEFPVCDSMRPRDASGQACVEVGGEDAGVDLGADAGPDVGGNGGNGGNGGGNGG